MLFFSSLHYKNRLGTQKRAMIICLPPTQKPSLISRWQCPHIVTGAFRRRWNDLGDHTSSHRGPWVYSPAISQACLINPSLWRRSETYRKGQLFSCITYVGNFQSRRAISLMFLFKDPCRRCKTLEHLYSNHQSGVWVSDFWSFWAASWGFEVWVEESLGVTEGWRVHTPERFAQKLVRSLPDFQPK